MGFTSCESPDMESLSGVTTGEKYLSSFPDGCNVEVVSNSLEMPVALRDVMLSMWK